MDIDAVARRMPWFLEGESKSDLFESVKQLCEEAIDFSDYFVSDYYQMPNELSQGDLVKDMPIISLPNPKITNNIGMVLSNSCGISSGNEKGLNPRLVYAPAVSLEELMNLLSSKMDDVSKFVESAKKQQIMNIFYLPKGQYNDKERVVLFDNMLSTNREDFDDNVKEKVIVRLSRKAYYHLLIKITAYFARTTRELIDERP